MGQFTFMEDWDLQAVVRGCSSEAFANIMNDSPPFSADSSCWIMKLQRTREIKFWGNSKQISFNYSYKYYWPPFWFGCHGSVTTASRCSRFGTRMFLLQFLRLFHLTDGKRHGTCDINVAWAGNGLLVQRTQGLVNVFLSNIICCGIKDFRETKKFIWI